jgi:hypothetical protein
LFILLCVAPVLGTLFFASSSATLSLAAVYAACAATLLLRPVGSALFGHYADVKAARARKPAVSCGLRRRSSAAQRGHITTAA